MSSKSGEAVAWTGAIPRHWKRVRLGSCFTERNESTTAEASPPLSVTKAGVVEQQEQVAKSQVGAPKKLARAGDLVINSRSDRKGSSGLAPRDGSVSLINIVLKPTNIVPRFAHNLLRSVAFQEEFYRWGTGIVDDLWSTRYAAMKNILLPLPPVDEQHAIAEYLDHETAEIDAFIADQEKLLGLAQEHQWARLASLIPYPQAFARLWNRAETGLVSLKVLGEITLGKMLDPSPAAQGESELPYLRAANVQPMGRLVLDDMKSMRFSRAEAQRLTLCAGDVVIVEGGVGGYGRAAYVPEDLPAVGFQNSIVRFRAGHRTDGRFVAYALLLLRHTGYISTVASVTSMPHFTAEKVAETPLPLMELENQRRVSDLLDQEWREANKLEGDLKQAIALAKERRAALISAAVTGQIDVTAKHTPAAEQLEGDISSR